MKALRLLSILAACCAFGTMVSSAWAAEPVAPKPSNESAAPKADEPSSAAQAAAQPSAGAEGTQGVEDDQDAEQQRAAPKPKAPGKGSPERFVPSEQVRADFDVSFPIDI